MQLIIDFLNKNPCLSDQWKGELLDLIEKEFNEVKTPTQIIPAITLKEELKEMLRLHEGLRLNLYKDSVGVKTIGYGFNMERNDAENIMLSVGAIRPYTSITKEQAEQILDITAQEAIVKVSNVFFDFDSLPRNAKLVLADMMFNLGPSRFDQFKKMIEAVKRGDYKTAALEMKDSRWYSQVGNRSVHLVSLMEQA